MKISYCYYCQLFVYCEFGLVKYRSRLTANENHRDAQVDTFVVTANETCVYLDTPECGRACRGGV